MNLSEICNATVLVRIDANLPTISDIFRLQAVQPTINQLLKNHNKILLLTHWGRPQNSTSDNLSTRHLLPAMQEVFGTEISYVNQFDDGGFEAAADKIEQLSEQNQQLFLLENTRFNSDEKSKDNLKRDDLAEKYAQLAQFFVDEAFAVSHRKEATNYNLKHFLPWAFGLRHQQEISTLLHLKQNSDRPTTVILGGAKPETKLDLITSLLPFTDHFLLGGLMAFTFLQAQWQLSGNTGICPLVKDTPISSDFLPTAQDLLTNYPTKFVLPVDVIWQEVEGKTFGRDVGSKTILKFEEIISSSNTVFWNGPLGMDIQPFNAGTIKLIAILQHAKAKTIIGGGDTAAAIPQEIFNDFTFISTGGGATLDFLASPEN